MSKDPADLKVFGQVLPNVVYLDRPGAYAFLRNSLGELATVKTSYGLFLPGGGVDRGEDELTALARELREEIGYELTKAVFLMRAAQFHWSEFYQSHFRKVGAFFEAEAKPPPVETWAPGHTLLWLPLAAAERDLTQEFQRWATQEYARLN